MARASVNLDRIRKARFAARGRVSAEMPSARAQDSLAEALGENDAGALIAGQPTGREARAAYHLGEVERLSRDGKLVREIADALDLSYSHVVALRGRLGLGRRR